MTSTVAASKEVEEAVSRIQLHKGVEGVLIMTKEGKLSLLQTFSK